MIRIFASGQSNMVGRATDGPDWDLIDDRVTVWNNVNPLGSIGTAFSTPITARANGTFDFTNRNNLGVWFADRMARELDDDVRLVMAARGATAIESWAEGETEIPMLENCIDVWAASTAGDPAVADVFIWHQGEGNLSTPDYPAKFTTLLANLEAGGVIGPNTLVIVGGLSEDNINRRNFNVNVLSKLHNSDSRIVFARSTGLHSYDGTHFDGKSLYRFGSERYYHAYRMAQTPELYVLANKGGTPGVPGSGENGVFNLPLTAGYRLRGGPIFLTASGTYQRDPEVAAIMVELLGGGAGGGGASGDTVARAGFAGSAGGYCTAFIESPESSYDYTIGEAGIGGEPASTGTNGGATLFGTVLIANGGNQNGSVSSGTNMVIYNPVVGGNASGGDFNLQGQASIPGMRLSDSSRMSAGGGNTKYGLGGRGQALNSSGTSSPGVSASGYGAGGGGGVAGVGIDIGGGDGAPGVIVIWEYVH